MTLTDRLPDGCGYRITPLGHDALDLYPTCPCVWSVGKTFLFCVACGTVKDTIQDWVDAQSVRRTSV
jgi:hypothetical protein